jgi:hypothetical protein
MSGPGLVRVASRVLAVVAPLIVLLGSYRALMSFHDEEDATAARNAGRVFNARVLDGNAAAAMDQLLAQRAPDVIVLGPSYANTDVDPIRLANRLGVARDSVALMSVPNSIGSHWYAMLKYRVFDAGYRPRLIVVVSGLQSMLLNTPLTESSFVNLEVQLPEEGDPLIAAKVTQDTSLRWARIREQRGKVRAAWFDWLRDAPLTTFTALTPTQVRASLGRVFDDARIDMRLHGSSIPVVEANRGPERLYDASMLPSPDQSFMGDATRLAAEHGAQVVWIRPPMSPFIPKELADVVLPGVQERAVEVVEQEGGTFLDMRGIPMTVDMFRNEDHMNEEGSRLFSERIASALIDVDAMYPNPGPGGPPPLSPTFTTSGAQARGTTPDAVQPGATAIWRFEGWAPLRGTFAADVVVTRPGGLAGVALRVDGRNVWLRPESAAGERVWGVGRLDGAPPPEGPFTVEIDAPADGAPVEVLALALGRRLRRVFAVGDAERLAGRALALVEAGSDGGGLATLQRSRDPVRVPGWDRPVVDLPGELGGYDTERWAFLSDDALEIASGVRCSPFRVSEDGALLPRPNVPCEEVERAGHGAMCHDRDRILFGASDGSDPARNGRTYRIVLDPARRCGGIPWLFPLEHVSLVAGADALAQLPDGARWLTLDARYLNHREAALAVRLKVDGETLLDTGFDARELKDGPRAWRLDRPVAPNAREVVVELESRGFVFFLLRGVHLSERQPAP